MSGFAEWQVAPAVAAGMATAGWLADEVIVRDLVPALRRGTNVVAVLPPAPAWATAVLAGLLPPAEGDGPVLLLTSGALASEWALTAGALFDESPIRVDLLREGAVRKQKGARAADLVIATPDSALDHHSRSALQPDRFRAIVFAWPEQWASTDAVAAVLQDTPRDAQRVVLTSSAQSIEGSEGVVERYARKAVIVNPLQTSAEAGDTPPVTSVRTSASSWAGRAAAVANVIDVIEPASVTIWTADLRDHALIRRTLGTLPSSVKLLARGVPKSGTVICYDPPSLRDLALLAGIGEVTLIIPPGTETYISTIAPERRPITAGGMAAAAANRDALLRQQVARAVESRDNGAALYALAPIFEQFDAQHVAAALFGLWQRAGTAPAPSAKGAATPSAAKAVVASQTAKLWIGAGKKDDATVADFVAVLVREAGMDRGKIGRIELRDNFALVEVPAMDAEVLARRVSGLTIRNRKLMAKVDGAPEAPPSSRRANPAPPRRKPPMR